MKWQAFLRRAPMALEASAWSALHADKIVLVTGAGGTIGFALAQALLQSNPRQIILLDHSEFNLLRACAALANQKNGTRVIPVLMDICLAPLFDDLLATHCPDIIYHAAAFKHVPLLESNPFAAVRNNVLGTYVVAGAARRHAVSQVVSISTDKAANPRSVLGASKRVAELVVLALSSPVCAMKSIRFGNVLGSSGSVVPLFLQQISQGGPVTVAHPEVCRYFLTIDESIRIILAAACRRNGGCLLLPELGEPIAILRLAEHLIREAGSVPGKNNPIAFTGLRPGDKLREDLISNRERLSPTGCDGLYDVLTPVPPEAEILDFIRELETCVATSDAVALVDALCRIVPEYQPSPELLRLLDTSCPVARRA